ncbi:MAG: hypothetical protein WCP20_23695, partial [Desulfuromonadales bacterium]
MAEVNNPTAPHVRSFFKLRPLLACLLSSAVELPEFRLKPRQELRPLVALSFPGHRLQERGGL